MVPSKQVSAIFSISVQIGYPLQRHYLGWVEREALVKEKISVQILYNLKQINIGVRLAYSPMKEKK